jgi:hypothetical protein
MNAQDNDGNTALHLAAEAGELYISSALLGNLEVLVNLWNNKNQSPLDLAEGKTTTGYSVSDPVMSKSLSPSSWFSPITYYSGCLLVPNFN